MFGTMHVSNHPPHTHTREGDMVARLRLLRSRRVGPATYARLMGEHGSAEAALAVLPKIALENGITQYEPCPEGVAKAELRTARRFGAVPLFLGDDGYPERLRSISDAPPLIWLAGRRKVLDQPTVAIVGARNASALGTRMARRLALGLGQAGYTVVSGLARGIDAAAHHASLARGRLRCRRRVGCDVSGRKHRTGEGHPENGAADQRTALWPDPAGAAFSAPQSAYLWPC